MAYLTKIQSMDIKRRRMEALDDVAKVLVKKDVYCYNFPTAYDIYFDDPKFSKDLIDEKDRLLERIYDGYEKIQSDRPLYDPNAPDAIVLNEKRAAIQGPIVLDPLLAEMLHPYQVEAVKFMWDCITGKMMDDPYKTSREEYHGCILADKMGIGKTFQCIALIWTALRQGPQFKPLVRNVLVVTPKNVVLEWVKEFQKWLGGQVTICAIETNSMKAQRDLDVYLKGLRENNLAVIQVLITSYDFLKRPSVKEKFEEASIDLLICDEAHRLRNFDTRQYTASNEIHAERRVIITGTPIQNNFKELYNLINFVNPGILGSEPDFLEHVKPLEKRSVDRVEFDMQSKHNHSEVKAFSNFLKQFMIRRTLVKEMPEKQECLIFCSPTQKQQQLLRKSYQRSANSKVFATFAQMRNICNHPNLEPKFVNRRLNKTIGVQSLEDSAKMKVLFHILDRIKENDDKVVVAGLSTMALKYINQICQEKKYPALMFTGETTVTKRQQILKTFDKVKKKGENFQILLLSTVAGGAGLNLTSAKHLIMYDLHWNPAMDEQAMARVWRLGSQKEMVYVYRLITARTMEEKILQRQSTKLIVQRTVADEEHEIPPQHAEEEIQELIFVSDYNQPGCETHDLITANGGYEPIEPPLSLVNYISCPSSADLKDQCFLLGEDAWDGDGGVKHVLHAKFQTKETINDDFTEPLIIRAFSNEVERELANSLPREDLKTEPESDDENQENQPPLA